MLVRRVTILACARVSSSFPRSRRHRARARRLRRPDRQPRLGHEHTRGGGCRRAWSFLVAGIAVWSRRPGNRLGPLMVATCFALLARQFRYSHDELVFTVFFLLGELGFALYHPRRARVSVGRVTDRRALVPRGRLRDGAHLPGGDPALLRRATGSATSTRRARACYWSPAQAGSSGFFRTHSRSWRTACWPRFIVLIARKLVTRIAACAADPRSASSSASSSPRCGPSSTASSPSPPSRRTSRTHLFWWQIAGLIALPIALLCRPPAGAPRPRARRRSRRPARADAVGRLRDALAGRSTTRASSSPSGCPSAASTSTPTGGRFALPEDGPNAPSRARARGRAARGARPRSDAARRAQARRGGRRGGAARARERSAARGGAARSSTRCRSRARGSSPRRRGAPPHRARPPRRRAAAARRARARAAERPAAARTVARTPTSSACSPSRRRAPGRRRRAARARPRHPPGHPHAGWPRPSRSRRWPLARRPGRRSTRPRSGSRPRSRRPRTSSPARRSRTSSSTRDASQRRSAPAARTGCS